MMDLVRRFHTINKWNLFYSICIYVNHFAFGITSNVIWAALVDIGYIYDVSSQTISYLMTFGSLGYLIGSISGSLYRWLNRQLTIVVLVTCLAVTMAIVPSYGSIWAIFVGITLNGIGGGTWDSNNNVWLVEMWPAHNGAPVIQASQFMYGAGTIVGPILVAPYVHGENVNGTSDVTPADRQRSLKWPFLATGIFQLIVPVIFAILYIVRPYRAKVPMIARDDRTPNNGTVDGGRQGSDEERAKIEQSRDPNDHRTHVPYRAVKVVLIALCLGTYDAAELGYFYFSPSMWQYTKVLDAEEAAHTLSTLSAAYTAGRLITAFISIKLRPDAIMAYHFVIIVIAQVTLFAGHRNPVIIYAATALLGYGFSAMWPAILAFTERYFKLTDRVGSLLFFCAGLVSLFTPFIIGPFLESTPLIMFAFNAFYLSLSLALFVALRVWIGFRDFSIFN